MRKWIDKITSYLKEVQTEMRKVAWPNRDELINSTSVVMVTVICVAIFIGLVDVIFNYVIVGLMGF